VDLQAVVDSSQRVPSVSVPPIYVAVVDDDRSVCLSFARLLRAAGIQPITYGSAEAFLADTKRPQFDCMVFDVQLSGMSGIELAQTLTARGRPLAPVIYITAHDDPETRASAEASGCAAYFRKNESGAEVLEAIRRLTR
jgi:FixJ family two-component response regulator